MLTLSIWWENWPFSNQESLFYGWPVIDSTTGCIEVNTEGCSCVHLTARNGNFLAEVMQKAIGDTALHQLLKLQIPKLTIAAGCTILKVTLYSRNISAGETVKEMMA